LFFISDEAAAGSDDWAKGAANITYSFTPELRGVWPEGSFVISNEEIQPTGEEIWAALTAIAFRLSDLDL